MKSLIVFAVFLQMSFANAALDLAGTNFIYSNTKDLAYQLKLDSNGKGEIITVDGNSPISWSQTDDNSVRIILSKPTAYTTLAKIRDASSGKLIDIEKSTQLEKVEVKKWADGSISVITTESISAPLAPQFNKTYQSVEENLVLTNSLQGEFKIDSTTDHLVLPSTDSVNDMYVSLKKGVVVDAVNGLEGQKFFWSLSTDKKTLTLTMQDNTKLTYSLAGVGPIPRTIGVATKTDGSKDLLSGRTAIESATTKATVQSFAGLYETVNIFESFSDMPVYQFNLDGTGGFKSVHVEDGMGEYSGMYTSDIFWSWTVSPEGVVTATRYMLPNGLQPAWTMADLLICMNPASACSEYQVRTHKIVSETADGILITVRNLKWFTTTVNPDGTETKTTNSNVSLWVLRKI